MEVYALIDDISAEKIDLKFLQPSSKGERVDISFLSNVPDNIRESADKGIKEAYFLLSHYYHNIPERISLWFRGLSKNVQGNSTDLSFAIFLISYMISAGHIKASNTPGIVFATGTMPKEGEVRAITGIKNKICAAIKLCNKSSEFFLFYPEENKKELDLHFENDSDFLKEINLYNIKLIPVKTLNDVLDAFGVTGIKVEGKKRFHITLVGIITLLFILSFLLIIISKYKDRILAGEASNAPVISTNITQLNKNEPAEQLNETDFKTSSKDNKTNPGTEQNKESHPSTSQNNPITETNDINRTKVQQPQSSSEKNAEKFFNVVDSIPKNLQENVETADFVKIVFSQNGLKQGYNFSKISVNGNAIPSSELSFNGNYITIMKKLISNNTYTVVIPEGALLSSSGSKNEPFILSFSTIKHNNTFKFIETMPYDSQTDVDVNTEIIIYSNTSTLDYGPGFSKIDISGGAKIKDANIAVNKNALVLEISGLDRDKKYTVSLPEGALLNKEGFFSEGYSFSFTTAK